ncbi:MAG TPA: twin-arginine translocation signal domain-containing protein, partial [Deltaproteobacteria bacterium]|nr:twin-arginine translocation signal domain-containing protein [Deltaproteobacteria bacterium]
MARDRDREYRSRVSGYYRQLMERCQAHMDRLESELPPAREDLGEVLRELGVTRRDFLKWTSAMTAALMLPPMFKPLVARAAENFGRLPVVWLHFAEC